MKVLGVDLSLTSTGLALIDEDEVIETTAVKTNADEDWDVRRKRIRGEVLRLGEEAELIALENYSYGSVFAKEIAGELGGINRLALIEQHEGREILLIAPTQVKKFVALHGRAPKEDVQEEIEKYYDVELDTDDESDALGLAQTALNVFKYKVGAVSEDELEDEQVEVIEKILED